MADATLIYDEDCGFCRWFTAKILRWDRGKRLRPLPLQSPEADDLLGPMDPDVKMASWHLVTSDGKLYSAGAAAPVLFRMLPGGAPLAALGRSFPRTTDRMYRWVADHRDQIGARLGTQACSIDPSKLGPSRRD